MTRSRSLPRAWCAALKSCCCAPRAWTTRRWQHGSASAVRQSASGAHASPHPRPHGPVRRTPAGPAAHPSGRRPHDAAAEDARKQSPRRRHALDLSFHGRDHRGVQVHSAAHLDRVQHPAPPAPRLGYVKGVKHGYIRYQPGPRPVQVAPPPPGVPGRRYEYVVGGVCGPGRGGLAAAQCRPRQQGRTVVRLAVPSAGRRGGRGQGLLPAVPACLRAAAEVAGLSRVESPGLRCAHPGPDCRQPLAHRVGL